LIYPPLNCSSKPTWLCDNCGRSKILWVADLHRNRSSRRAPNRLNHDHSEKATLLHRHHRRQTDSRANRLEDRLDGEDNGKKVYNHSRSSEPKRAFK
jgi:hypothetical protein